MKTEANAMKDYPPCLQALLVVLQDLNMRILDQL